MNPKKPFELRENVNTVEVLELKALLHDLSNYGNVLIRFRTLGSLWQPSFLRILRVTETGVVLAEPENAKPVILSNLNFVIQFEIDTAFRQFQPNNHYDVKSSLI